jgi:hypothetical protein
MYSQRPQPHRLAQPSDFGIAKEKHTLRKPTGKRPMASTLCVHAATGSEAV